MNYKCPKCDWSLSFARLRKKLLAVKKGINLVELFKCSECGHPIPFDILGQ